MSRLRPLLVLATPVLLAAACTTQESVAPATAVTSAATSTAPATTSAPTTTTPETTVAPTDPPTTTAPPPTTTPPPSGQPTATPTEYFAGGDPDGWLYVGRWTGDGWDSAEPAIDAAEVLIHEIGIEPIDGMVGATIEVCGDQTGPVISPNARAPEAPGFGYRSIAYAADWDTEPRQVAVVDADIESYAAAAVSAFDGQDFDVDASEGEVRQIVVTDLDGDRDSEVLVTFGGADFSALLLVDADSGEALTIAIDGAQPPPPSTTTSASSTSEVTTTTAPPPPPVESYRTLAVADLNGDGLMEVVVHLWNDEDQASVVVYTYDGTDVTQVLSASC